MADNESHSWLGKINGNATRWVLQGLIYAVFTVIIFWLNTTFVTQKEFRDYKATVESQRSEAAEKMNQRLTEIRDALLKIRPPDVELADHEQRLRELEKQTYGR